MTSNKISNNRHKFLGLSMEDNFLVDPFPIDESGNFGIWSQTNRIIWSEGWAGQLVCLLTELGVTANDWRHSWYTCDVIVGTLPVFVQCFVYPMLLQKHCILMLVTITSWKLCGPSNISILPCPEHPLIEDQARIYCFLVVCSSSGISSGGQGGTGSKKQAIYLVCSLNWHR